MTPPRAFPPESYFQMELRGKLSHRQSWGTAEADEQEANLSESCDGVELEADCSSDDDSSACMWWFVVGREGEGRRRGEVLGWGHGHGQPAAPRPPSSLAWSLGVPQGPETPVCLVNCRERPVGHIVEREPGVSVPQGLAAGGRRLGERMLLALGWACGETCGRGGSLPSQFA